MAAPTNAELHRNPIPLHYVRTRAQLQEALERAPAHPPLEDVRLPREPLGELPPPVPSPVRPEVAHPSPTEDRHQRDLRLRHMQQLGIPAVDLTQFPVDPNAVRSLPLELARKHHVMPLLRTETQLAVAMAHPLDWQAHHTLEFFTGLKRLSSAEILQRARSRHGHFRAGRHRQVLQGQLDLKQVLASCR